jgi:hypothetical protein
VSVALPDGGYARVKSLSYKGGVKKVDSLTSAKVWEVASKSDKRVVHQISKSKTGQWMCSCPSYRYHHGVDEAGRCKHIREILKREEPK